MSRSSITTDRKHRRKSPVRVHKATTWTIHPGEILREEYLIPLKMSAYRLAKSLEVPAPRIHDIVRERRSISADTALRLAHFFDTTPNFWMNLQTDYDLRVARNSLDLRNLARLKKRSA